MSSHKAAPAPVTQAMDDALRKLAKRSDAYVSRVTLGALVSRGLVTRDQNRPNRYSLTAAGRKAAGIEEA